MTVTANTAAKTSPRLSKSKRPLLLRLLPYLLFQLAALLLVEMVLGLSGLGEEEIFRLDKNMGTMHMTDKSVTWRKEGYARSYFDHDGMREHGLKIAKPAGTYRIALLGDSLVEGLQVPIEDTFGKVLEKRLSKELQRPVQVLNFGTSGYSTVQEYLQLENKIFKYSPDMVLASYNSRDMFENWSEPDQTLTNVRPYALKLPNRPLVVDSSSVTAWMRSPRAKLLMSISWIREKSRIWGLISAAETEASFHNEVYRTFMAMFTQPGKTFKSLAQKAAKIENWQALAKDSADSLLKLAAPQAPVPAFAEVKSAPPDPKTAQLQTLAKAAAQPKAEEKAEDNAGAKNYINLMKNTQEALYLAMKEKCLAHNCRFLVLALPSRATLSPIGNMAEGVCGTKYEDEVRIIGSICSKNQIPFIDGLKPAMKLTSEEHSKMFYTAHMTAVGHKYLADLMEESIARQVQEQSHK